MTMMWMCSGIFSQWSDERLKLWCMTALVTSCTRNYWKRCRNFILVALWPRKNGITGVKLCVDKRRQGVDAASKHEHKTGWSTKPKHNPTKERR